MKACHVIAVDLGAESGRVMDVHFDGHRLEQTEVHRFSNTPVCVHGTLYWDILRLWHEIQAGIDQVPAGACSVGIDAWGVDFALLDRDGNLLGNPVHYRDARTDGMVDWVFERVPRATIFDRTGIQVMQLNTLYQFASLVKNNSPLLETARTYLAVPDLLTYWLSGSKGCEFKHATTTQNFAYLSSGTWSLLGLEVPQPIINEAVSAANVTNEGGFQNTFRFLKNVVGLWIVQQCRATWAAEGTDYTYDQLTALAAEAEPFRSLINPDAPDFLAPGDMPSRIRAFCQRTGQPEPETVGQTVRTVFESLALRYRMVLDNLVELANKPVDRLHIIGGGGRNKLLCQMTADSTGREVVAGPYEATALGNAIVQLIALGAIDNLAQAREILSRTQDTAPFYPEQTAVWNEALSHFRALCSAI
jgi:sugar (pentulose or hexulose) kinase